MRLALHEWLHRDLGHCLKLRIQQGDRAMRSFGKGCKGKLTSMGPTAYFANVRFKNIMSLWCIFLVLLQRADPGNRRAYIAGSNARWVPPWNGISTSSTGCETVQPPAQSGSPCGAAAPCWRPSCSTRLGSVSREVAAPSAAVPIHLFPAFDENSAAWLDWISPPAVSIANQMFKHSYLSRSQKTKYYGLSYYLLSVWQLQE